MRKKKRLSGVMLIIAALIIMQLPVSEADAATSSASDFKIEGGVLVKYRGTETNVSVPDTVEVIGEGAFEDNTRVELVVLPNSVERIEPYAFWGCEKLDTVVLGKGMTEVGDYAFAGCGGLEQMTIPSTVRSIGVQAFADCVNLKDVSIAAEVTDIHETAFDGCYRLTIHCAVGTTADKFAQKFYERQKEMPEYQDVPDYQPGDTSSDNQPVSTPAPTQPPAQITGNVLGSTRIVGNRAVLFMDNTLPVVMSGPEGLGGTGEETGEPVGDLMAEAPEGGVAKYTVVDGRIVADQAYYRDQNLEDVVIPAGITQLGQFSFARSSISSVSVPFGVSEICYGAFYHCNGLSRVYLPQSVMLVEPKAFAHTAWVDNFLMGMGAEGNESGHEDYLVSGGVLVAYKGTGSEAVIPDGVRVIAGEAFWNHTELESVVLPQSVTVIGEGAFEGCSSLSRLHMGNNVQQIKDRAFAGCKLLQVTLPASVNQVGLDAFGNAQVSFAGDAFAIPNNHEFSASRLSNEDYRGTADSGQEPGVTVTGLEHAYASLEGAATGYTLTISQAEDTSLLEQACVRSFKTSAPDNMTVYDFQLTDSSGISIKKLGHQELTVVLPVPAPLSGQKLQILTLDRNGQPELIAAQRVMADGVESVRFSTGYLSQFGIYGLGEAGDGEEVIELDVDMTSLSAGPVSEERDDFPVFLKTAGSLALLILGSMLIFSSVAARGGHKKD